jgi:hypothetical protein
MVYYWFIFSIIKPVIFFVEGNILNPEGNRYEGEFENGKYNGLG